MQLLASWRDSLRLLLPPQLKLFVGAIFLTLKRTYRVWLGTWWWLIAASIALGILNDWSYFCHGERTLLEKTSPAFVWLKVVVDALLSFTLFLSVRPSVAPKTYAYFMHYWRYLPWLFMGFFAFRWSPDIWDSLYRVSLVCEQFCVRYIPVLSEQLRVVGVVIMLILYQLLTLLAGSVHYFYYFFLLDSTSSLRSAGRALWNAIRMTLLSLPLIVTATIIEMTLGMMVIFVIVYGGCFWGLAWVAHPLSPDQDCLIRGAGFVMLNILGHLLLPLVVACLSTIYVKRLYDNSALYLE